MLRFFYRWRYQRAQRVGAYKLPSRYRSGSGGPVSLASYLSQTSVRGRTFSRFDLPHNRRRWLALVVVTLAVVLLGWIILESIAALKLFRD
ncbi:MAG: hypothetical protein EA353_08725 [Puniceicoccaceae bacterium]|nr:MAG: hypothetical protein EA353_08725 [Puniceicoccaceae bacterium]